MDGYLGTIMMFGGNFAPRYWMFCHGQLLLIAHNTSLFSLLGTLYGGNGSTNFALPDLRGRVPVGVGTGPGLSPVDQATMGGSQNTTLLTANLPAHSHTLNAFSGAGTAIQPAGNLSANTGAFDKDYASTGTLVAMGSQAIGSTGSGQAFSNMQPYVGINYIICVSGTYPARD